MEQKRQELVKLLTSACADFDITPTELAKSAGISPSTLTRFLAAADASMLSMLTIARVERAIADLRSGAHSFGLAEETLQISVTDTSNATQAALDALLRGRPNAFVVQLGADHALALPAHAAGDYLLVDPDEQPRAGDVACAQRVEWQTGHVDTVYRVFDPPYLLANNTNDPKLRKPLIVDNDMVALRGRVFATLRIA